MCGEFNFHFVFDLDLDQSVPVTLRDRLTSSVTSTGTAPAGRASGGDSVTGVWRTSTTSPRGVSVSLDRTGLVWPEC